MPFTRITKPLVTENDLIEAPAQTCIHCAGLRRLDGILCPKCLGEGRIVTPRDELPPQVTGKGLLVFFAKVLAGWAFVALLLSIESVIRWLHQVEEAIRSLF